jgi:hypothetical protein
MCLIRAAEPITAKTHLLQYILSDKKKTLQLPYFPHERVERRKEDRFRAWDLPPRSSRGIYLFAVSGMYRAALLWHRWQNVEGSYDRCI